jgi:hypothetical protein
VTRAGSCRTCTQKGTGGQTSVGARDVCSSVSLHCRRSSISTRPLRHSMTHALSPNSNLPTAWLSSFTCAMRCIPPPLSSQPPLNGLGTHSPSSLYTIDTARQGASVEASEGSSTMGRHSCAATILAMSSNLPPATCGWGGGGLGWGGGDN